MKAVADTLSHLSDPVKALEEGVAVVLETTVAKLDSQPTGRVREAIGAVIGVWRKVLGGLIGPDCVRNVLGLLQLWQNGDEAFHRWPEFVRGMPASP